MEPIHVPPQEYVAEKEYQGMTRRGGFVRAVAQAQRETERRKRQQALNWIKAQSQAAKTAEQTKKAYERASAAEQKESAQLYAESRLAHVNLQNEELEQVITRLNSVLTDALAVQHFLDVQTLKPPLPNPVFTSGPLAIAEPPPAPYLYQPPMPTGLQKLLPGAKERTWQQETPL